MIQIFQKGYNKAFNFIDNISINNEIIFWENHCKHKNIKNNF